MDLDEADNDISDREKRLTGIRLFKDQIEKLKWLALHKYRDNRTSADLVREAVDRFIDEEDLK